MFEKITLCIYGLPLSGTEGHILYETAKNDVPLDKLNNTEEYEQTDKLNLTNDDIELLNNYTIDQLIAPYIKCEILGGLKKAYLINPPNMNMVEKTKTGYIYYENDLIYYVQSLYNFYLIENKSNKHSSKYNGSIILAEESSNKITFETYFKKICDILKILLDNNKVFLEDDCVFNNENYEIFHKIPETVVDIIINSLSGKLYGYTEVKLGLKLLRLVTNSGLLVNKFIERAGFELLYMVLLNRDSSLVLKVLTLECIYKLITHIRAFNYFMENMDKARFTQQYFMIKESTKDLEIEKEDKKPKKKSSKKKSKRKSSESRSARSRSRSRDDNSISSDSGFRRNKKKKQAKNILLKNGYQIILTMIVGKRNHLVVNLVKKIVNKVSLQLYLREFSNFVEKMVFFYFILA
jgi:hypothetical protein